MFITTSMYVTAMFLTFKNSYCEVLPVAQDIWKAMQLHSGLLTTLCIIYVLIIMVQQSSECVDFNLYIYT